MAKKNHDKQRADNARRVREKAAKDELNRPPWKRLDDARETYHARQEQKQNEKEVAANVEIFKAKFKVPKKRGKKRARLHMQGCLWIQKRKERREEENQDECREAKKKKRREEKEEREEKKRIKIFWKKEEQKEGRRKEKIRKAPPHMALRIFLLSHYAKLKHAAPGAAPSGGGGGRATTPSSASSSAPSSR